MSSDVQKFVLVIGAEIALSLASDLARDMRLDPRLLFWGFKQLKEAKRFPDGFTTCIINREFARVNRAIVIDFEQLARQKPGVTLKSMADNGAILEWYAGFVEQAEADERRPARIEQAASAAPSLPFSADSQAVAAVASASSVAVMESPEQVGLDAPVQDVVEPSLSEPPSEREVILGLFQSAGSVLAVASALNLNLPAFIAKCIHYNLDSELQQFLSKSV